MQMMLNLTEAEQRSAVETLIVKHALNKTSILEQSCDSYLWFESEIRLGKNIRICLYLLGLAYCFIGLSAITARFFKSMENVVKQTKEVISVDPLTGSKVVKQERIWNYTLADISLLAFGTSFPQISLAIIDALQNLGQKYAGGLGPGTLVGSAAFDLYPIHAVCVVIPKAGTIKKISDLGVWFVELMWSFWAYVWLYIILQVWTPNIVTVWEAGLTIIQFGMLMLHAYVQDKGWKYVTLPFPREDRPKDWVPVDTVEGSCDDENDRGAPESNQCSPISNQTVDIFSIHYSPLSDNAPDHLSDIKDIESVEFDEVNSKNVFYDWLKQFCDILPLNNGDTELKDYSSWRYKKIIISALKVLWNSILFPWRFLFAFVPPCNIAHGWVAFICSLCFITGISYVLTRLTDLISCVTGINPYVIAFTALASGTSWPDMVASKIAAERQETADSAIANITCSNSANLFLGIGVPWFINTAYNMVAYSEPLYVEAEGLSFSLIVFFATFVLCMVALVLRRYFFGGELGGPRVWAWITCFYLMFLWIIFVVLSSLKVSNII